MFEYVTMERLHMINIMTTMEKFSEYPYSHRQSNGWKQFCIVVCFFFSTLLPSICIIFIALCRLPFQHKVHFYSHTLIYCQRKTLDISPKKGYFSWCLHNIFADWRIITISTSSDWKAYHSNTSSSSNQPKCIINERVRERVSCWVLCSPSNEIVYQKRAPFARHCTQTRFDSSK